MPQSARLRPALTEPIFGSAKRTSRTLAVRTYSGGWARICAGSIFPDASSFFSCALADRISLASRSARRRCSRDLPGTVAFALPTDTQAILGAAPGARINRVGWRWLRDASVCRGLLELRHEHASVQRPQTRQLEETVVPTSSAPRKRALMLLYDGDITRERG